MSSLVSCCVGDCISRCQGQSQIRGEVTCHRGVDRVGICKGALESLCGFRRCSSVRGVVYRRSSSRRQGLSSMLSVCGVQSYSGVVNISCASHVRRIYGRAACRRSMINFCSGCGRHIRGVRSIDCGKFSETRGFDFSAIRVTYQSKK